MLPMDLQLICNDVEPAPKRLKLYEAENSRWEGTIAQNGGNNGYWYQNTVAYEESYDEMNCCVDTPLIPINQTGSHGGGFLTLNQELGEVISSTVSESAYDENDPQNRQVCFGMVRLNISLHIIIANIAKINTFVVELFDPRADAGTIDVAIGPSDKIIAKTNLIPLGQLEAAAAALLQLLSDDPLIELQIQCRISMSYGQTKKSKSQPLSNATLSVIIYGPFSLFNDVGYLFEENDLFLQDPLGCDRIVEYRNPHRLSGLDSEPVMTSTNQPMVDDPIEYSQNVVNLLSGLENGESLQEAEAPQALRTPLHKHQKQALAFMKMREQGWQVNGPMQDMWSKDNSSRALALYINNINGRRQNEPPCPFYGGIIADHMGLGKSLSMIALIASDVDRYQNATKDIPQSETKNHVKSTLLIVPSTLIENWEDQLTRHLHSHTITWRRHYSKNRLQSISDFQDIHLVITSFQTVASEWKRSTRGSGIIFTTNWRRIILDEAHCIRDSSTLTYHAVQALHSRSRWAVTGTPIQNKLTDLRSLLQFLKVYPYTDPNNFDFDIIQPWKVGEEETALTRLRKMLGFIMLRRSRNTIELPQRRDLVQYLQFNPEERIVYEEARRQIISTINEEICSGTPENGSYLNALQRVNALRMICNLGVNSKSQVSKQRSGSPAIWTPASAQEAFNNLLTVGQAICSSCSEEMEASGNDAQLLFKEQHQPILAECLYLWCGKCSQVAGFNQQSLQPTHISCGHSPPCSTAPISTTQSLPLTEPGQIDSGFFSEEYDCSALPTKIKVLLADIQSHQHDTKSIVFSFWTSTLDVVEVALKRAGVGYRRYDGRVSTRDRAVALEQFASDPSAAVLLLSISCGAVGLNLTAASRAYLLEPHWNPTVEDQALARIHRMGQRREVTTVRYIIRDSFEEHVVRVQNKKNNLIHVLLAQKQLSQTDRLQHLRSLLE